MKAYSITSENSHIRRLCLSSVLLALLLVLQMTITAHAIELENNAFSHPHDLPSKLDRLAKQAPSQILTRQQVIEANKISRITLSPNGDYLAYLMREDNQNSNTKGILNTRKRTLYGLWVMHLKSQTIQKLLVSPKISRYAWAASSQGIFNIAPRFVSYLALPESLIKPAIHIHKPTSNKQFARPVMLYALNAKHDEYFLRVSQHHPAAILVVSRDPSTKIYSVFSIDESGIKTRIVKSQHEIIDLVLSSIEPHKAILIKEVRGAQSVIFDIRSRHTSPRLDLPLRKASVRCNIHDPCSISRFDEAQNTLYLLTRQQNDVSGLYQFDLSNTENVSQLVHQDPRGLFDIDKVFYKQNKPFIAAYQTEATAYYSLNTDAKHLLLSLRKANKLDMARLTFSNDLTSLLVNNLASASALQSLEIFSIDPKTLTLSELAGVTHQLATRGNVNKRISSERFSVAYTTSDNMNQFGYVTLPRGYKASSLPLVVMPHGGPWSRSSGEYNPIADFIASRGYAVFEANFRSSQGMGLNYLLSANKDFGNGRVQQDIIDGMHAILSLGIGSADALAMVGHSFGGFSVLAGLSFTPDLFSMGFAGAPPSDLVYAIEFLARNDFKNLRARRQIRFSQLAVNINDKNDTKRLSAISPASHWQHVNKPLYIWAGKHDDRVDIKKVKVYAKQVFDNRQGKETLLFSDPYSGHSPSNVMAMDAYFYLIESSLHKHLAGRVEENMSTNLASYIKQYTVLPEQDKH